MRKWQPIPVFLPGKSHEQGRLTGYSPRGLKELNKTEQLNAGTHTHPGLEDVSNKFMGASF